MRIGDAVGDGEQEHPNLYNAASYRDLFVLAGAGESRAQIQVLNRDDSCCFSGVLYRGYDNLVASATRNAAGHFRVYLDTTHSEHQISPHVLSDVILARLTNDLVYIADAELGRITRGQPLESSHTRLAGRAILLASEGLSTRRLRVAATKLRRGD
jgi:hypothetical protein